MSSIKVSALTAKTTPTGSEEVLINDGGTSKKITITNLTKGHDLPTVPSGITTDTNKEYNLKLTDVSGTETLTWIEETDNDTTYSTVTTSVDGLAPTLPATHGSKFLRGDATWVVPTDTDTTYSTATATTEGLVKIEDNAAQTVAANTVTATVSRTYGVQLNASDQAVVNVPWTDTDTGITDVVDDTTPQLGGSLDVNGNSIVSASNGDIAITPHGTGDVVLDGLKYPSADGTAGYVLKTDGSAQLSWVAQTTDTNTTDLASDTTPQLGGDLDCNGAQIQWSKGADVASATALPVLTDGNYFDVTGTTTVTSINTTGGAGTLIKLHFDAILILTHHATDLILPSGANITTAAGDEAEFIEYDTGDYRCTNYSKADGTSVVGGLDDNSVTLAKMAGGTDGNLITYDASGDPAYVTTGTSGQVLTSGGVGVAPTFQTAASGISYTDAWHLFLGASVTITGTTTLDFTNNVFIGSNVSESGGAITVTDAGLYLISCTVTRNSNTSAIDLHLYIGSTAISGTRFWVDSTSGNYAGKSGSWVVRLSASDVISVKGEGYFNGSPATGSMTFFSGVRLGD